MMRFLSFCFFSVMMALTNAQSVESKAKVVPRVPAVLDVLTFAVQADGENHKMVITLGAPLVRVDEPDDRYSILYDPHREHYIGLEHSNDTYWEFAWPAVQAQVAATQRYADHLRDLASDGANGYDKAPAETPTDPALDNPPAGSNTTNITWQQTTDKKTIAGIECVRWTGDSALNENVEAWCFAGSLPKVRAAMEQIRAMNEPMALVPMRMLVPSFVFPVYDALVRGGVTPVAISWGDEQDQYQFRLLETKTRDDKPVLFAIPPLYLKTTLVTMDGITNPVDRKR